jgi:hypothetical protein
MNGGKSGKPMKIKAQPRRACQSWQKWRGLLIEPLCRPRLAL